MRRVRTILRRDSEAAKCAIGFAGKSSERGGRAHSGPKDAGESRVGEEAEPANGYRDGTGAWNTREPLNQVR